MKVRFLLHSLSRRFAGLVTATRPLARELARTCELEVVAPRDPGDRDAHRDWQPLAAQTFPAQGPFALGYAPRLAAHLHGAPADLHHVHGLWVYPSRANLRWARRTGRPYVVSPHGMLDTWALAHSRWKKRLAATLFEQAHLRGAACLHALCEPEREAIRAFGLRNPVCVIPNGIDLPAAAPAGRPSWRDELPPEARVMLFLGRLHPKKGLPAFLEAWTRAGGAEGAENWHLVIAGWDQGGHQEELQALAQESPAGDRIHFIGAQFGEEKEQTLATADAFVLPSLSEGLPMTVLEAWAWHRPVLMTRHCNLPEGFTAGAALELATVAGEQARTLAEFFALPEAARRALGERGRALVEERFTWPEIARQMRAVYDWVLNPGSSPPPTVQQLEGTR